MTPIILVLDRFTKMAYFIALHENTTTKDVLASFLWEVGKLHGSLREIICDLDAKLSGKPWESLCKMLGVK